MATREKSSSMQLMNVKETNENDVLFGRGGGTNHHPGNKAYRKLVDERKQKYVESERLDKPKVAIEILRVVRNLKPPGRFLKFDENSGLWNDVGDKKAREKVSQALREGAPDIRGQQDQQERKERSSSRNTLRRAHGENSRKTQESVQQAIQNELDSQLHDSDLAQSDPVVDETTAALPVPRPFPAKRATSHEYENTGTKKDLRGLSVKRTALNGDMSPVSNNLKKTFLREGLTKTQLGSEQTQSRPDLPPRYPTSHTSSSSLGEDAPEVITGSGDSSGNRASTEQEESEANSTDKGKFESEKAMRRLSHTLEQTCLNGFIAPARQFSDDDRMRDMDYLYAELTNDVNV